MEYPTVIRTELNPDRRRQRVEELRELVAALAARVPRLERAGEVDIVRDSAALRREALQRIAELERSGD